MSVRPYVRPILVKISWLSKKSEMKSDASLKLSLNVTSYKFQYGNFNFDLGFVEFQGQIADYPAVPSMK